MKYFLIVLAVWNIIVFLIYGADKAFAKLNKRRISERALILYAFLMGGIGAKLGMILFRHKTLKLKFRVLVPIAVVVEIAVIYSVVRFYG